MNRAELHRRARLWQRHHAIQDVCFSGAAGLVAAAAWPGANNAVASAAAGLLAATGAWFLRRRKRPPATGEAVAALLNRHCPTLEESAELWLRDTATLSLAERLQRRRLESAWNSLDDRATLGCPRWQDLRTPALSFVAAALMAAFLLGTGDGGPRRPPAAPPVTHSSDRPIAGAPPVLHGARLSITPPAYTGLPSRQVAGLDAEIEEGAEVTWELETAGAVAGVWLEAAGAGEALPTEALGGGRFRARTTMRETRIYQVALASAAARVALPGVHVLKLIRDQPPRLAWREPTQVRTLLEATPGARPLPIRVAVEDDYGIAFARLVVTVAKGTGEGVKFREREFALDRAAGAEGAAGGDHGCTLDLAALGLEAGDELYFHVIAADRRQPAPNLARSETRFAVLGSPGAESTAATAAVAGVNRLPQYFRSQRQLIIDTERLLAERPQLTEAQFISRSTEIGIDQKLLRLRYGQFLGEEFEPASTGAPREAQAMELAATLRREPRAETARAAAVMSAVEAQHRHEPAPERDRGPATIAELRAPFVHEHDSLENATFHDARVKASLRAVLNEMWRAEGHLRVGDPAAALPAEHRALEQLKILQQADRLSVRRVGQEAAPVAVDTRRLRGDLEAIPRTARQALPPPEREPATEALGRALAALGRAGPALLSTDELAQVEARLIAAAQAQPGVYAVGLELWRRGTATLDEAGRERLRRLLWALLPPPGEVPARRVEAAPHLARVYLDALARESGDAP